MLVDRAEYMIQEFQQIRVLIAYDGIVHWEPGGVFMTTCDIHILYFPFDMQACQIELGKTALYRLLAYHRDIAHRSE